MKKVKVFGQNNVSEILCKQLLEKETLWSENSRSLKVLDHRNLGAQLLSLIEASFSRCLKAEVSHL